jgi:DNA-binding IscR family transcriptional regulator
VTRDVWKEATRALVQVLASKTIEELKNEAAAHARARQTNYDI